MNIAALLTAHNRAEFEQAWFGMVFDDNLRSIVYAQAVEQVKNIKVDDPIRYRALGYVELGAIQMSLNRSSFESGKSILLGLHACLSGNEIDIMDVFGQGWALLAYWTDHADRGAITYCTALLNEVSIKVEILSRRVSGDMPDALFYVSSILSILNAVWLEKGDYSRVAIDKEVLIEQGFVHARQLDDLTPFPSFSFYQWLTSRIHRNLSTKAK